MNPETIKQQLQDYPFLSVLVHSDVEYVGIIQNKDASVISFYDYSVIAMDETASAVFLDLAQQWWWGSNRQVPIHLFIKRDWAPFRCCLKTFITKTVVILHGPVVSLNNVNTKRVRKRSLGISNK
jgi:hypothetical protein